MHTGKCARGAAPEGSASTRTRALALQPPGDSAVTCSGARFSPALSRSYTPTGTGRPRGDAAVSKKTSVNKHYHIIKERLLLGRKRRRSDGAWFVSSVDACHDSRVSATAVYIQPGFSIMRRRLKGERVQQQAGSGGLLRQTGATISRSHRRPCGAASKSVMCQSS
jgi:hypothetical protein